MQEGASTARSGGRGFVVLSTFIAGVIVVLWFTWQRGDPYPDGAPRGRGFACAYQGHDRSYCEKLAREWSRRTPVSDGRRDMLGAYWDKKIEYAASYEPWCGTAGSARCANRPEPSPPTDSDLAAVRATLARQGFPDAVVRFARSDDPAPPGALLYAVRVESACVVGHLESVPSGPHQQVVLGLLPDGRCLPA